MEHFKTLVFSPFWICIVCFSLLTGCKKAEEHPENLDPIYSDLMATAGGLRGKAEAQKKKISDVQLEIDKAQPRDPAGKHAEMDKANLERGLVQIEQETEYYEIRAEQRRLYDKESYMKAFNADQPWPSSDEYSRYLEAKKLRTSSRDWSKNVPVDKSHNKFVPEKKKKAEAKKEE